MDSMNQPVPFEFAAISPVTGNEPIARISLIWLVVIVLIILFYNRLRFSNEITWFFVILIAFLAYVFVAKSRTFPA